MAKKFAFRLETLLRVRGLREREAKRNVAAKRAEIARLDALDRQTADEIQAEQETLLSGQSGARLEPLALQRGRAWIAHLRRTIALRAVQRQQLQAELAALLAAWREARKQQRIIEKLRERRWSEYVAARDKADQAADDEMAQQLHVFHPQ